MSIFKTLWARLLGSKEYREEFVAAYARRAVPFQVRAIMRKRGITQPQLAEASGLTQGVISRATNPAYGRLTLNTIIRLVVGLDMGLIIRIVPVSRMAKEYEDLNECELSDVATFDEENKQLEREPVAHNLPRDTKVAPRLVVGNTAARQKLESVPSGRNRLIYLPLNLERDTLANRVVRT